MNLEDFAETVVYYFAGGGSRSVNVIVDREPTAFYDDQGNAVLPSFTIEMHNNCTTGVSISEIDTGGDDVSLLLKTNDVKPERRTVMKVLGHDKGAVTIAVR